MKKQEEYVIRPLYRPRTWLESERSLAKASKKSSWAKAGWTPGEVARAPRIVFPLAGSQVIEEMKKTCKEFVQKTGIHVKVCPMGGNQISRMVKSGPLKKGGCHDLKCMVCTTGGKGVCRKNGAGYRITCLECPKDGLVTNYERETGQNAFSRGLEHQDGLRNEERSSPICKHCIIHHNSRKVNFRYV